MKRSIKIGERNIPLWIIVALLISIISTGVLADYLWKTIFVSVEVKEPLEIVYYPSTLSLYPGETEEFNITIENHASVNYSVILDFSLDNTTYQDNYVMFSNEIYTVIPKQQNLTAWIMVKANAPPINASLSIDFLRIEEELVFFDDFSDELWTEQHWTVEQGNFEVMNGEYFTQNGFGEESRATADNINVTDCIIEVKLRFSGTFGLTAWIVFRWTNEHYYRFYVNAEYQEIGFTNHTWYIEYVNYPIGLNVNYTLKVEVIGNTFTGFLNGVEILSVTDSNYLYSTSGRVGLGARYADVFFDDLRVTRIS